MRLPSQYHFQMKNKEIKTISKYFKRKPESNKYDYGHILVVAGSKFMPGAGVLCCNSAMRSGVGLVTYAVNKDFLANACALSKPETMFFVYKNAKNILNFVKNRKVKSLIIGPGLLVNRKTKKIIRTILKEIEIPVILDASALAVFKDIKEIKANLILTPHDGEFYKLTGIKPSKQLNVRKKQVKKFAKENNLICVLKGNKTIVCDGNDLYINNNSTPALATAGSGDVLSGIIAAFSCVLKDVFLACCFGVFIHSMSGQISQKEKGVTSVIASDIVENIAYSLKNVLGE